MLCTSVFAALITGEGWQSGSGDRILSGADPESTFLPCLRLVCLHYAHAHAHTNTHEQLAG